MRKQSPSLYLQRTWCYDNCTVGRLTDSKGRLLCMTLEPRWREAGTPCVKGKTCILPGTYKLVFSYDTELRYQCWKLTGHSLSRKVRLCFLSKNGSVATHTRGDILLGYLSPVDDEEKAFDGRLYRPVEAFSRLRTYYASLRANHGDLVLRIDDPPQPVQRLSAIEAPQLSPDRIRLEDYILQTL